MGNLRDRSRMQEIQRRLVEYWALKRDASDSLEGIALFWLEQESTDVVLMVLEEMVEAGMVGKEGAGDTALYYWAGKGQV